MSDRNPLIGDESLDDAIERGRKMIQRSLGVDVTGTGCGAGGGEDKSKKVALGKLKNKGNVIL
jgi:hypothetical protein